MSHGQEAINIIVNLGHESWEGDAYRYHDRHVDDTQCTASFLRVRNGWKAAYHFQSDTWKVTTPSGLQRTYEPVG